MLLFAFIAGCATQPLTPTTDEVLAELSQRTAVPSGILADRLARCPAEALCPLRDQVASELTLELAIRDKVREIPSCRMPLDRALARFQHRLLSECDDAACKADLTHKMLTHVRHLTQCARP